MVKPFCSTELVARIQAALHARAGHPAPFALGEVVID